MSFSVTNAMVVEGKRLSVVVGASKLGAGREKDLDVARAAAQLKLVDQKPLLERLKIVQSTTEHTGLIAKRIAALFT